MKRSIRIDDDLVKKAEAKSAQVKRSVASQIEYWAEIGIAAESSSQVSKERLQELGEFSSSILNAIKQSVDSGNYRDELLKSGFAYEKSKMGLGFVDKVFPDQTRITGRVVNGEFVELNTEITRLR